MKLILIIIKNYQDFYKEKLKFLNLKFHKQF